MVDGGLIFVLMILGIGVSIPVACCVFRGLNICCHSTGERRAIEARRLRRYENATAVQRAEARIRLGRLAERDLEANIELENRRIRPRTPPPEYASVEPPPPVYGASRRGFELRIRSEARLEEVHVGAGRARRYDLEDL